MLPIDSPLPKTIVNLGHQSGCTSLFNSEPDTGRSKQSNNQGLKQTREHLKGIVFATKEK